MSFITVWLDQYGYIVLFLSLLLELIAFPIPGEPLMGYCGLLVYKGQLNWLVSILVATIGSCMGMTLAYYIGCKLGTPFFQRYGHHIHLGPERLQQISKWFERYGNKVIIIGYFIPGVRHFTGYFSGVTKIPFRNFAIYAYLGAFVWTSVFISVGKILGPEWEKFHESIKKYLLIAAIVAGIVIAAFFLFKKYKQQLYLQIRALLEQAEIRFHSIRRLKVFVTATALTFLGLVVFMLSLIEDYVHHEFELFDAIVVLIVTAIFQDGLGWLGITLKIAVYPVTVLVVTLTVIWIWLSRKERWLEVFFVVISFLGGELLEEGLRRIFHRVGPGGVYSFPSEQAFIAVIVYGSVAYLLIRQYQNHWFRLLTSILFVSILMIVGISCIALAVQYPSDVVAGYVFGGVWLFFTIIWLEIFRLLAYPEGKQ